MRVRNPFKRRPPLGDKRELKDLFFAFRPDKSSEPARKAFDPRAPEVRSHFTPKEGAWEDHDIRDSRITEKGKSAGENFARGLEEWTLPKDNPFE